MDSRTELPAAVQKMPRALDYRHRVLKFGMCYSSFQSCFGLCYSPISPSKNENVLSDIAQWNYVSVLGLFLFCFYNELIIKRLP